MLAGLLSIALLASAPGDGPFVGPPAPPLVPVLEAYAPTFVGPPAGPFARPAPEEFWMLSSVAPAPAPRAVGRGEGYSLDAALAPPAPAAGTGSSPSVGSPRVEMDRLSDLGDVLSGMESLDLGRRSESFGWGLSYSSGCDPVLRPRGFTGWYPRCWP